MPHRSRPRGHRRHRAALLIAAVPLMLGGVVAGAIAAPSGGQAPDRPVKLTAAAPDQNCTLILPADPLSARGLATPYRLTATDPHAGPCHEADSAQSAFVQGTVYDPATGALSVYDPLVIDAGTRPAIAPPVPSLPADAVVGIWFGFNAGNLTLASAGGAPALSAAHCVNGLGSSVFGQYAYCDAEQFFAAVDRGVADRRLAVPALGTALDGEPCPTTRDYSIVDQDPSDNVTTQYLATPGGSTAQNTPGNHARLAGSAVLGNPSDNALVDEFVDPALGCKAWRVPDLVDGRTATSLALDEIQANADQAAPRALVPLNDPMTLLDGSQSTAKTDLYRAGVDQRPLPAGAGPRGFCQDMDSIQSARLKHDLKRFAAAPSPDPAAADNLLTFLAFRLQASFGNLGCASYGLTDPVASVRADAAGVVVSVTFAT